MTLLLSLPLLLFDAAPLCHCLSAAVMPFYLPLMLSHAAAAADTPLLPFFAAAFRRFRLLLILLALPIFSALFRHYCRH
jgi:hypothetical protein